MRKWTRARLALMLWALALSAALAVRASEGSGAFLGSDSCLGCHDAAKYGERQTHMRVSSFEVQGRNVGCEGCHGPGEAHAEEGDPELIRRFGAADAAGGAVCLGCHRGRRLGEWHASAHAAEGIGCETCHSIHEERAAESSCATCHAEAVASFMLPSHHPVREGKMSCSSCHDVHAASEGMLKTRMRSNDLCFTCHQDKEGPFIFEHAPVQEDCSICHTPHGSVANNLLTANEPMLCVQCHDFHFHAGYRASDDPEQEVGGEHRENPFGAPGFNMAFTTSCTQCHSRVHGSDTPSQTSVGQGRGLTH